MEKFKCEPLFADHAYVLQALELLKKLAEDLNLAKKKDEELLQTSDFFSRLINCPDGLQLLPHQKEDGRVVILSAFAVTNSMSLSSMTAGWFFCFYFSFKITPFLEAFSLYIYPFLILVLTILSIKYLFF